MTSMHKERRSRKFVRGKRNQGVHTLWSIGWVAFDLVMLIRYSLFLVNLAVRLQVNETQ